MGEQWVLDAFCDRVTRTTMKEINKRNEWLKGWKRDERLLVFSTEIDAWIVAKERAEHAVAAMEKKLSNARKRVKKCEKRVQSLRVAVRP